MDTSSASPDMSEALPSYESLAGRRTSVRHKQVAEISVMRDRYLPEGETPEEVEIAFFDKEGNWVLDEVEEFAEYADNAAGDTRVYPGVPFEQVQKWVVQNTRDVSLGRAAGRAPTREAPGR